MSIFDIVSNIGASFGIAGRGASALLRFAAEPQSRLGASFSQVKGFGAGGSDMQSLVDKLPLELRELTEVQLAIQLQMQQVATISNVIKDEHEMHMAVIRNLQVS